MDMVHSEAKVSSAAAPQRMASSHEGWLSDYLAQLQVMWLRASMPAQAVLLLVDQSDYAGNLVLSMLRSRQRFTQVHGDSRATVGYARRLFVEEAIRLVYESLSLEFTPPQLGLLNQTRQAILVFAEGEVSVSDGRLPFDGGSK